jgi:membrane protein required for colicin V production
VSLLDLLLVVIVGGSIVGGFMAGFARAGVGFFAAIFGILFGFWFYGMPASWYVGWAGSRVTANMLGFFTVFFATVALGALLGRLFSTIFKWTGLSWLDRILGAGFGLVRGALVAVAFVAVLMAFTPRPTPHWMVGSKLLPYAVDGSDLAASLAPRALKDAFSVGLGEIRKAWADEYEKARRRAIGLPDKPAPPPPGADPAPPQAAPKSGKRVAPKGPPPRAIQQ